jgi:hypothetical protein
VEQSSGVHRAYIKAVRKSIIDEEQVLRMFSEDKERARRLYQAYVSDGTAVKKGDIYGTIDKRILGDERFADTVMGKCVASIELSRKEKEYSLAAMTAAIGETFGVTLRQMRQKGKNRGITRGRKLLSLVAHEYGYRGREIAEYMRRDPALITRHIKEKEELEKDSVRVIAVMRDRQKGKCQ